MALFLGGILVFIASVGLGFFARFNVEENFGNMLILVASTSGAAGLMLMGMSAVVTELKRIGELLETLGDGVPLGRRSSASMGDSTAKNGDSEGYDGDFSPMPSTPIPTTWGEEPKRERPRNDQRNDQRRDRGGRRGPDLRPVPDNVESFDDSWQKPGRQRDRSVLSAAAAERAVSAALAEDQNVSILKSGVVDGMAYSLYSDGSIEAQMPEGILRFSSLEELRGHLNKRA